LYIMHYFLHFGIHENGLTITQNALILHLVGALPPIPSSGSSAPCIPARDTAHRLPSPPPSHHLLDPPLIPVDILKFNSLSQIECYRNKLLLCKQCLGPSTEMAWQEAWRSCDLLVNVAGGDRGRISPISLASEK